MEIATLEEKLEENRAKIDATIGQLKGLEEEMDLVENRDEYWTLLQAEKRIDKLEGPPGRWSGLMKKRDDLGRQRAKLLSRLTQTEGREAKRARDLSSGRADRRMGKAEKEDSNALDPSLGGEEREVPGSLARPVGGELSERVSSATPSGAEEDMKGKEMKEVHADGMKGKGKAAMTNTEVEPANSAEKAEADEEEEDKDGEGEEDKEEGDSDSSMELILERQPTSGRPIWE